MSYPNLKSFVTVLIAAVFATACATGPTYNPNPDAGDRKDKTAKGAGIGAAAGAILGAATGDDSSDRRKRALIGAGVGALAGAGVGVYMDRQEAQLRSELSGTGVEVDRRGEDIVLNMPGNITFATDSSSIRPDFYSVLDGVGRVLDQNEKTVIEVDGHTDSQGAESYNEALSQRRAQSVADYLMQQGIDPLRIITRGYGETRPVATNESAAGRQQNRRVEMTLTPITS